jgi:hypothetical protein
MLRLLLVSFLMLCGCTFSTNPLPVEVQVLAAQSQSSSTESLTLFLRGLRRGSAVLDPAQIGG